MELYRPSAVRKPVGMLAEAKEGDEMRRCPRETGMHARATTPPDLSLSLESNSRRFLC